MLFNSYIFIFLFLPIVLLGYYLLGSRGHSRAVVYFLTVMSLGFYGYNSISALLILFVSIVVNYVLVCLMQKTERTARRRIYLIILLIWNIGLLFVYKYFNFFLENINLAFDTDFSPLQLLMPLGISFYTFQQISYGVDCYRKECKGYQFSDYLAYITFFPSISSGPIVYHSELIPQLQDPERKRVLFTHLGQGLYAFSLGLAKKVLIADTLAKVVSVGYANIPDLNTFSTILVMLSYSLQIYFDFSGYCDMALGISRMLNLDLPVNFNSPYKAVSITDFWDRWHMTLTRFFTKYVYIPLGGSRRGLPRTLLNVMIVFLVSGLWHGANWTFILWGALHGLLNVLEKALRIKDWKIPVLLRRGFTFSFVTLAWSIFRAPSLSDSMTLFGRLFSGGFSLYQPIRDKFMDVIEISVLYRAGLGGLMESKPWLILTLFIVVLMAACFTMKNTQEKMALFTFSPEKGSRRKMLWKCMVTAGLLFWSILSLAEISEFLYFTF